MNPADWIERHAGQVPNHPALEFGGDEWNYGRLWREVERLVSALASLGIAPGDRIAWLGLNSPQQIAMLAACARLGACFMPINWRLTAAEQWPMLQESAPALLVVDAPFVQPRRDLGRALPDTCLLALNTPAEGVWLGYEALVSGASLPGPRPRALAPERTLLLCYTSGTSGRPKGVMLSQHAVLANALSSIELHAMCADDVVLTTLPLFHVGGLNNQTTPALYAGASVLLHPKFDVDAVFDAIEQQGVTLTVLVPAQLAAMMAHPRWVGADFSRLRMITTGSTIVPEHVIRAVHTRGVPLVQIYGATETCPIAAALRPEHARRKAGSAGQAAGDCALRIIDVHGQDLPTGQQGEVLVQGSNLMSGYWKQPEASATALAGGWFHSGDIGHFDEDGYLWIDGRGNDMIISGGENIAPAEIENVLLECSDIAEVSVVGAPDGRWGQIVVAVIAPAKPGALDHERVLALLEGRVARYKYPKKTIFIDELPKTALGKVRKSDVLSLLAQPLNDTPIHPHTGAHAMTVKIGIDVGGTFTDFVVTREGSEPMIFKTLSTPSDPSVAVVQGLTSIAQAMQPPMTLKAFAATIDTIVHGTTVTTNATLTGRGASCALLTTEGVRDALEMRRGIREEQYNNRYTNVRPLVPRARRAGIAGRLDRNGREIQPLDLDSMARELDGWRAAGVEAVAVCFMNAFANPAHEQAAAALVRERMPDAYLSVSTEVLPSIRFYERLSTTALNAYVGPKLEHYLDQLLGRLAEAGFSGLLLIMQSNGGVISPQAAREKAALTLLSGPAGGPGAGLFYAGAHGQDRCITTDMGGTSFEASVAVGQALVKNDGAIARHSIALPMLDIHTIGAGGGSIGWLDDGGMLRMGPQSAGADPGPACYGVGGELPTTTDANLVLGYLDPDFFAGGQMRLDLAAARAAIETHIARPMGLSIEQAAAGMYRVACNNMAQGVREVTIKRGFDPREFPLIPGGGAGPIHGCLICHELDIPLQIVPREASVLCAFGMLMSELRHDYVRTFVARLNTLDWQRLGELVEAMTREGEAALAGERVPPARRRIEMRLDCRYLKQYHEVSVTIPIGVIAQRDVQAIADAFQAEHLRLYGYALQPREAAVEIINVRLQAIGATERPALREQVAGDADASAARKGERAMYIPERDAFATVPVFDGHHMRCGHLVRGPALIEQQTTAIFVSDGFDCQVDPLGSFVLYAKGRADLVRIAQPQTEEAIA